MRKIRFALRVLAKTPVVSLVVILSLGLGIGANTAIFSLLHQVLLRTLPVESPERLVVLTSPADFKSGSVSADNSGGTESVFSYRMFRELERSPSGLSGLAAYREVGANMAFQGKTLSGNANMVSGNYFPLLGVQPLLGRALAPADDQGSGQPVAVLSFGYWRDRLGGRSDVLNQPMRVNGQVFTIVGVAPRGFTGLTLGDEPDIYVPLVFKPAMTPGSDGRERYDDYYLYVFGRLSPGASPAAAQSALNGVYGGLVAEQVKTVRGRDENYLKRFRESRLTLEAGSLGQSEVRKELATPLTVLMICTALVLLIAAANAANLLLARAAQRSRELSIRAALGGSRGQIMRQLLAEAMLLSVAGGVVGLLIGRWVLSALVASFSTDNNPVYTVSASPSPTVLLFSIGVALLTGLLFGLYPAWSAARSSVSGTLKDESANSSSTRGGVRARKALVTAQVAISLLLLIPMGLFLKSMVNLLHVDLGLRTENTLTFQLSPALNGYTPERSHALFERVEQELAAIPGVVNETACTVPLISGSNWGSSLRVEGYSTDPSADAHSMFNIVGAGFLGKMGMPLISGREFTERDNGSGPKVVLVNETWVKHFFPAGQNPLGRKVSQGGRNSTEMEIVGVVKDSKYSSVREKAPRLFMKPYRQVEQLGSISFYVRSTMPVDQTMSQIRRVISSIDPDLPIEELRTMDDQVKLNIRSERMVFQLATAFGVLATALAMLGLYGVMAFNVARRTREIGIRMALGAPSGGIRFLVLREVLMILAIGVVLGVPAALALARMAESQLFGVKAYDPGIVLLSILALSVAALLAGYLPARRATRINPVQALHYE